MAIKRNGTPPGYSVQRDSDYPGDGGWFHKPSNVPMKFYATEQEAKDAAWREAYDFCTHCGASIPPRLGEGTCPKCDPDSFKRKS